MIKLQFLIFSMILSFSASAVNVGEVTSVMVSERSILAKEISNNTESARYISINIERLSSPMAGGVVIPVESKSELLPTPASIILPANSREIFKFIYNGPDDDNERYYRLSWMDEPITDHYGDNSAKVGQATASAIISTILVVAPRKDRFSYAFENGKITNTGNSSFRLISYGPCRNVENEQGNGCRERYYLMPGVSSKIKYTDLKDKKTRIGIWYGGKYTHVQ